MAMTNQCAPLFYHTHYWYAVVMLRVSDAGIIIVVRLRVAPINREIQEDTIHVNINRKETATVYEI